MIRRVAGLLVVAALAGCSTPDPAPRPDPATTTTTTTVPTPADKGLRPVTMTYRDGLAYVFAETAAQALCHALTPAEWRDVLGGDVGRTIDDSGGDSAACVVVSGPAT